MNFRNLGTRLGVVLLAGLLLGAGRPAHAGFAPTLVGHAHHLRDGSQENGPLTLVFHQDLTGPGTFDCTLNTVPIKLKLTAAGKITFSGKLSSGGKTLKVQGGQALSAFEHFIDGKFTVGGDLQPEANGTYIFELVLSGLPTSSVVAPGFSGLGAGVQASGAPAPLAEAYAAFRHNRDNGDFENDFVELHVETLHNNGKFEGSLGTVPITGKITNGGKVTFSGQLQNGGDSIRIKKGKGQISATGKYLHGTFQVVAAGTPAPTSGKYFFDSTED